MAAVISSAIHRSRSSQVHKAAVYNEPLSFHVTLLLGKDFVLPADMSSVDILRMPLGAIPASALTAQATVSLESPRRLLRKNSQMPSGKNQNFTGTRIEMWTKKFKSSSSIFNESMDSAWQERLVIVTDKRIFIVTKKQDVQGTIGHGSETPNLEIVDSIPLEEITSIGLDGEPGMSEADVPPAPPAPRSSSFLSLNIFHAASSFIHARPAEPDPLSRAGSRLDDGWSTARRTDSRPRDAAPEPGRPPASEDYCEPILRIATEPGGFNHGQTYHFLLRKQARTARRPYSR